MPLFSETLWVIMTKDRTLIAKGNVRNRHLVPVNHPTDKKRVLTYPTKATARAAFQRYGFRTGLADFNFIPSEDWFRENLEPVPVLATLEILENTPLTK